MRENRRKCKRGGRKGNRTRKKGIKRRKKEEEEETSMLGSIKALDLRKNALYAIRMHRQG